MNLEQLRSLESVVRNKSFSMAARELYVTQPTISMHIKSLEAELGEQLLVRSTKDILLSEAGILFFPYAVQMLNAQGEALARLKKREECISGEVRIVASSVPANYIVPGFLSYAGKRQDQIVYRISEGDSMGVAQKVQRFEDEIGIGGIQTGNSKCLFEPFISDHIILITPNQLKYREKEGVFDIEELKRETFIVRESGSGTRFATESLEKKLGIDQNKIYVAAEVQTTELLKRVVSEGVGVGFVSSLAARDYLQQEKILAFEFDKIATRRQLYLIRNKEKSMSVAAKRTILMLKEYAKQL